MSNKPSLLVPLDGSAGAENAVAFAKLLAPIYQARLDIVYALDPAENSASYEAAAEAFRRYGESLAARQGLPADVQVRIVAGPAARTLIELADASALVVMVTHGRGGFRAMFVGSVADKVVRSTDTTTVLVPAVGLPPGVPRAVLVPLDGSVMAESALATARRLAGAFGARVVLLRAYNASVAADAEFAYYNIPLTMENDARQYLAGIANPDEERVVVDADATDAIVRTAEQYDAGLVVLTSSGKGLAGRLILGSTTDRVMRSLRRPLMIIHAG